MNNVKQGVRELDKAGVHVRDGVFVASRDDTRRFGSEIPAVQNAANDTLKKAARPRRVLVVEDNLDSVHSLVFLLRDMGHHVDYAINGYVALDLASVEWAALVTEEQEFTSLRLLREEKLADSYTEVPTELQIPLAGAKT
jgi:hypothetical protein